jgi:hypothetical protein
MTTRGPVRLTVTFGPTTSPTLPVAVAYARSHAAELTARGGRRWRAVFVLEADEEPYGRVMRLLEMVWGWRSTDVEVQGRPEPGWAIKLMALCARGWIRRGGTCLEPAHGRGLYKCSSCPLEDPDWAARLAEGIDRGVETVFGWDLDIPDHLPEDWGQDPPED